MGDRISEATVKFDGIHYYGADADPTLTKMADNLLACPFLKEYHTCQRCPKQTECEKLWNYVSGRSKMRQLKSEEADRYRRLFRERIGVMI